MREQAPPSPGGRQPPKWLDVSPDVDIPLELEEPEGVAPELEEPEPEEPEGVAPELEEPEPEEPEGVAPELEEPEPEEPEGVAPELEEPEPSLVVPEPMLDEDAPLELSARLVPHPCEVTAKRVHKAAAGQTQCIRTRGEPSALAQRAPSCRRRASVVVGLCMLVSTLPQYCTPGC
jgi:hypothetical protein